MTLSNNLCVQAGVPLRVYHVSKLTGLSPSAVQWNAREGNLKYFRDPLTPKFYRFQIVDVLEFVARRKRYE